MFSTRSGKRVKKMPLSIKVNLRVTGHCNQGGRKYMEDMFSVAYQQTSDDKDLEYAFFGIFDGHGGGEAATFAKEHLMDIIVKQRNFWSDKDEDVLRAIKDGYINTHYAMWRELDKWPTTASGLPSTAGTTASVAFIRKGKIYIGHVGDSGIILGYQEDGDPQWKAKALTKDHKPESGPEMIRIQESGGKVVSKSGVPRVVWNRPRIGHKGPVRRSTHIDEIPFLAVARSLGDLWSYNSELDTFVVSPEPDVKVVTVDVKSQRCLIFGTDGLWNMLTPQAAVAIVQAAERHNEKHLIASQQTGNGQADVHMWINPSKSLVDTALERWFSTRLRADNTSVVTLMLDPPGPSRSEVLMNRKNDRVPSPKSVVALIPRVITPIVPLESTVETSKAPLTSDLFKNEEEDIEKLKNPDTSEASCNDSSINETNKIVTSMDSPKIEDNVVESTEKNIESELIEASKNRESIQVAEISSSDAFDEKSTSVEEIMNNDEMVRTTDENSSIVNNNDTFNDNSEEPIIDTKLKRDVTPEVKLNKSSSSALPVKPSSALTKNKTNQGVSLLVRQNAFYGNCEELQNRPRLRRTVAGTFATINRSVNHDKQKDPIAIVGIPSVTSRRQSGSLVPHLEPRSVRRRQSTSVVASTGFYNERKKSYFNGPRLKREALSITRDRKIETIVDKKRKSTNAKKEASTIIGSKRRHSSSTSEINDEPKCSITEPSAKRRTRSEDRPGPIDENDPANQRKIQQSSAQNEQSQQHSRLRWPEESSVRSRNLPSSSGSSGKTSNGNVVNVQEKLPSPNSFQRRSLEKKATPVKTIRRPSINGSNRSQLRGSFALREWDQSKTVHRTGCNLRSRLNNRSVPPPGVVSSSKESSKVPGLQRWLRSDTLAATPVKTLRSRNVDITGHTVPAQGGQHQYGSVKQNRLSLPAKIKIAGKVGKSSSSPPPPTSSSSGSSSTSSSSSSSSTTNLQTGKLTKQSVNSVNVSASNVNTSSSTVITKRVKSPYNTSARSALGTRSRLKRLGK